MKKKILIGSLALVIFTTLSSFDEKSMNESARRPMFGSEITNYGPCYYTGEVQADGTRVTAMDVETTTYIFWIGFPKTAPVYNQCTP